MYKNSLKTCIFAMVPMSALVQTIPLDTMVVTGTANPLSGIRSSAAFSTLDYEQIQESAPSSAADILRNVPGVISQASGGERNANVSVRGLPIGGGADRSGYCRKPRVSGLLGR